MLLTDIHDISTSMSNNEECEAIGYDFNNGSLEPKGLSHKRKLADLEKPPSKKLRWNEELVGIVDPIDFKSILKCCFFFWV